MTNKTGIDSEGQIYAYLDVSEAGPNDWAVMDFERFHKCVFPNLHRFEAVDSALEISPVMLYHLIRILNQNPEMTAMLNTTKSPHELPAPDIGNVSAVVAASIDDKHVLSQFDASQETEAKQILEHIKIELLTR